ncbi:hypothetical protein FKW77_003286 [Venturia effusa]|uniref:2EXR domain-containing protein n=1 Tax=Venturia effusa TaxID=50376 RepID=A0A517L712_9PEZI|nr:hypothetical protein FKW77_003286 [Venturia effusa]
MARKSKKIRDDRPFPFLKLPAELRNRIYDLALTFPKRVTLTSGIRKHSRRQSAYRVLSRDFMQDRGVLNPSILRVNKQIYHEAMPVFYNQPLEFVDAVALYSFLAQIGQDAIPLIRQIRIERVSILKEQTTHPAFTILAYATNLEALSIGYLIANHAVRNPYRGSPHTHSPLAAQPFFQVAHVWFEQMDKNKTKGGKDWRDVFVLDEATKSAVYTSQVWRPGIGYAPVHRTPCTMDEIRAGIEEALKPTPSKLKKR